MLRKIYFRPESRLINNILNNVGKQTELCRSKLASLSTQRFRECQGFIEKVGEIRFNKVTHRQVNKLNNLRKKGNITWVSTQSSFSSSQAGSHPPRDSATSQAVGTAPWEGLVASQAGRCSPSWGQHYFPGSQHSFQGRK